MIQPDEVLFLQGLLKIDSTNPPGDETGMVKKLIERARSLDLETEIQPIAENRANLIIRLRGNRKKPPFFFCGHMDTVGVGGVKWEFAPFSGKISEGKMYGRGASDMKSGLAAMIEAMGKLKQTKSSNEIGDILLVATAGEEVDCLGAKHAVQSGIFNDAGAMVIGEPTNREVVVTHKGALWVKITTFGKTAHGSMPKHGVNAIAQMIKVISYLEETLLLPNIKSDMLGEPTVNIGTIHAGVQTNVVPDTCEMTIDVRTLPGMNHQSLLENLDQCISELGIEYQIDVVHNLAPLETKPDHQFVLAALEVNEKLTNRLSVAQGIHYYTDGSIIGADQEFPIIIYGPGDRELAHQPNEFVEIENYLQSIDFYRLLAERYFENN